MAPLPAEDLDRLVAMVDRAITAGDEPRARVLLASLASQAPHDQRIIDLRRRLDPSTKPLPVAVPAQPTRRATPRWIPLAAVIGSLVLLLAVVTLLPRLRDNLAAGGQTVLPTSEIGPRLSVEPIVTTPVVLSTSTPDPTVVPLAPDATAPAAQPLATLPALAGDTGLPTLAPAAERPTVRAPGEVVAVGQWQIGLLRAQDAVFFDGPIGAASPRGRFVLALMSVYNSGVDAPVAAELFVLVDERGQRYPASAQLSAAYLAAFGRGTRGDLALGESMPGGGAASVPVIFEVPAGVSLTTVTVGALGGWVVAGG